jgi:hypothetical protein
LLRGILYLFLVETDSACPDEIQLPDIRFRHVGKEKEKRIALNPLRREARQKWAA